MVAPDSNDNQQGVLAKRLRRGGAWTVAGRTAGMAVVLVNYMLLARLTSASDFAAFVLVTSIVSFASTMAMFGLNTLLCRFLSESLGVGDTARAAKALFLTLGLAAVSISVVGMAAYPSLKYLGGTLFQMPLVEEHAGLIAVWIMLLAASQLVSEGFRGLHDLRMAALLTGMSGGLLAHLLVLSGTLGLSLWISLDFYWIAVTFVVSLSIATLVSAFLLALRWRATTVRTQPLQPLTLITIHSIAREAWSVMLVQVLSFGIAQLDIWIVGMYGSETDLAVYGVARRLCLLVAVPLTQISMAISSSIAELHTRGDRQDLQRIVRGAATLGALASALPIIVLMVFAELALAVIVDPAYQVGAQTLRIMLLGQAVFAMTGPCGPVLMMTGHQRVNLWTGMGVLPLYALCPLAASVAGLEGIALIFAVSLALQNLIQWLVVARLLDITTQPCFWPSYVRRLVRISPA